MSAAGDHTIDLALAAARLALGAAIAGGQQKQLHLACSGVSGCGLGLDRPQCAANHQRAAIGVRVGEAAAAHADYGRRCGLGAGAAFCICSAAGAEQHDAHRLGGIGAPSVQHFLVAVEHDDRSGNRVGELPKARMACEGGIAAVARNLRLLRNGVCGALAAKRDALLACRAVAAVCASGGAVEPGAFHVAVREGIARLL